MLPTPCPSKLDFDELIKIQKRIAEQVIREDRFEKLETVAGCDVSFAEKDLAYASCALFDYEDLEMLKQKTIRVKLRFPYIPTFLSFRELEGMLKAIEGLEADIYMVGAQGLAHPRRAGLACHLGVTIDKPTLGVAKSKLCGEAEMPPATKGAYTMLKDDGETIGALLRTKPNAKPVCISIGHKLSLETSIEIALRTTREHRLPYPLRIAHKLATEAMRRVEK